MDERVHVSITGVEKFSQSFNKTKLITKVEYYTLKMSDQNPDNNDATGS